jgi:molybdopterin molybdotransferase
MLSVPEALGVILSHKGQFGTHTLPLSHSLQHFLAEPVLADRDFPPFDRVTMDGIALHSSALAAQQSFHIEGIQAAGMPQLSLNNPENCLEVMTGAMLPLKTDTIVPYESLNIENGVAYLQQQVQPGRYIHARGSDLKAGSPLLGAGQRIRPGEIGLLATVGMSQVSVHRFPRIAIVSTGDELVEVDQQPLAHQIRKSNVHVLEMALQREGIQADAYHILDEAEMTRSTIARLLSEYEVLLLSGGVSEGKYDLVPQALEENGVAKIFHKVAQRPGKPFWFGKSEQARVFAFPGNPISTYVCFAYYFRHWLYASCGSRLVLEERPLGKTLPASPNLGLFLAVSQEGPWLLPVPNNGSGDMTLLSQADGFLLLPSRGEECAWQECFAYLPLLS